MKQSDYKQLIESSLSIDDIIKIDKANSSDFFSSVEETDEYLTYLEQDTNDLPVTYINLDSQLIATKAVLNSATISKNVGQGFKEPVFLLLRDGKKYVVKGHNRIAAAKIRGDIQIPAKMASYGFKK